MPDIDDKLPARPQCEHTSPPPDRPDIRPGSWWRLADATHPIAHLPAPDHGMVLMVENVRIIDGAIHSVVLHPHPLWGPQRPSGGLKYLVTDFLTAFSPESAGAELREAEIAAAMGRVQAISETMVTPPDPASLLSQQGEDEDGKGASDDTVTPAGHVPAALLPGEDVIAAQKAVETRIAAFEAQRSWITRKTEDLKAEMDLVAAYQSEKVNTTLAAISQETSRAEGLLQNVKTMRLFLGEDMSVTGILDGPGADPSEPLTFMQRMLFLDEEIIVNSLLEGFSDDQMDPENLADIFNDNFGLVERMLPFPRCAAIVRVRRHSRTLDAQEMDIVQIFEALQIAEADKRVHILVRDGQRLHMVTADDVTSRAERFFPSRAEIDALFHTRSYLGRETREILPDNVDYAEAREKHDERALSYKRFLILLWGLHERTDIFGPFMDKGANWLAATTHDTRFRFVHDEEDALEDGRPDVATYITNLNAGMAHGSRALVYWKNAFDGENAPALCDITRDRIVMKAGVALRHEISQTLITAQNGRLFGKAPALRDSYNKPIREFDANVRLAQPASLTPEYPDRAPAISCAEGVLCLDHCRLEDVTYYIESRAARRQYLRFAHLLNAAHETLTSDRAQAEILAGQMDIESAGLDFSTFDSALHLWRSGNKWRWPQSSAARKKILTIAKHIANPKIVDTIKAQDNLLRGGVTASGKIFAFCDTTHHALVDATPLPWLEERILSDRKTAPHDGSLVTWSPHDRPGYKTLHHDTARETRFLDRCAPFKSITSGFGQNRTQRNIRAWKAPRGLFDAVNHNAINDAATERDGVHIFNALLRGAARDNLRHHVREVYRTYRSPDQIVQKATLQISLGVVTMLNEDGLPAAWLLNGVIKPDALALQHGERDYVRSFIDRTYASPDRIFDNLDKHTHPADICIQPLALSHNLARAWISAPQLTFHDAGHSLLHAQANGWQDALAMQVTRPDESVTDSAFHRRVHSRALLDRTIANMTLTAAPDARDLLSAIFAFRADPA